MECCVAYVLATPVYAGIILPGCLGVRVIGRPYPAIKGHGAVPSRGVVQLKNQGPST